MTVPTFVLYEEMTWRHGRAAPASRCLAEETAIALSYNGSTHAVMMATPADLADFGLGFSVTEAIVKDASEMGGIEVMPHELGIEIRMWLRDDRADALAARRRAMSGPVGCGLCGIESLEQARRTPRHVTSEAAFDARDLHEAMRALEPLQVMNRQTRAVHAAAFWHPEGGIVEVREDVGRHNALDKLAGAIIRGGHSASEGALLLTSRVSVEMVQKAAMIGAPVVVAVSAPTALAIRTAEEAGITLVAVARNDGFGVFTQPQRVILSGIVAEHAVPACA